VGSFKNNVLDRYRHEPFGWAIALTVSIETVLTEMKKQDDAVFR
jgi:hypothetical protein